MRAADPLRYQAFFCEENVWWLCQDRAFGRVERRVVFISNRSQRVLLRQQRAGLPEGEVIWDYHVILLVEQEPGEWWVWDQDTMLATPVPARDYLASTFIVALQRPELAPIFRVIDAPRFVEVFATDRSHMRRRDGSFRQPPPPWPAPQAPGAAMNLMEFVDVSRAGEGELLDLGAFEERYAGDRESEKV